MNDLEKTAIPFSLSGEDRGCHRGKAETERVLFCIRDLHRNLHKDLIAD
jgi:hypothetical protein